jgi:hypothetical protein
VAEFGAHFKQKTIIDCDARELSFESGDCIVTIVMDRKSMFDLWTTQSAKKANPDLSMDRVNESCPPPHFKGTKSTSIEKSRK